MAFESTAQPRALDGLYQLCLAQAISGGTLDGVTVIDGPSTLPPSDALLLYLGDPPVTGGAGVLGTQEFAILSAREREESFTIFCTAYARSGDSDTKTQRDLAYGIMAAVERICRPSTGDVTLGGTVRWSGVGGRVAYSPAQSPNGAVVRLAFEVQCEERLEGS